jgi:hypothetical protein
MNRVRERSLRGSASSVTIARRQRRKAQDMSELIFVVEESVEGGLIARALGESIFTQATDIASLRMQVRDAVQAHFDAGKAPKMIRLHYVRDEVIAA